MPDPAPAEVRSAGAVLWRPGPAGPEVAVIHRERYDDWSFPKGKREPGEHPVATAVREVAEETGVQVTLGRPLGQSSYSSGGLPKLVV
jgi:8-oxo-dGTP pyrophosphatase MutT (NUDIX family)